MAILGPYSLNPLMAEAQQEEELPRLVSPGVMSGTGAEPQMSQPTQPGSLSLVQQKNRPALSIPPINVTGKKKAYEGVAKDLGIQREEPRSIIDVMLKGPRNADEAAAIAAWGAQIGQPGFLGVTGNKANLAYQQSMQGSQVTAQAQADSEVAKKRSRFDVQPDGRVWDKDLGQFRQMSPMELAEYQRMEAMGKTQTPQAKDLYLDREGNYWRETTAGGNSHFENLTTGAKSETLPDDAIRAQNDYYTRTRTKDDATDERELYDLAEGTYDQIEDIDKIIPMLEGNAGPTAYAAASRFLASNMGLEIGDTDASNISFIKSTLSKNELQATKEFLRGQGQITEGERAIVRNYIGQIDSDPEALKHILEVFKRRAQRTQKMADDYYDQFPDSPPRGGFKRWSRKWMKDNADEYHVDPGKSGAFTGDFVPYNSAITIE